MSLDINSLLGTTAKLGVAVETYDCIRDGGSVGSHVLAGDPVPAGAYPMIALTLTTTGFTYDSGGNADLHLHGVVVGLYTDTEGQVVNWYKEDGSNKQVPAATMFDLKISTAPILTGAFTIWLLYFLP